MKIDDVRSSFTIVEEIKPTDDVAGKRPRAHPILIAGNVLCFCELMSHGKKKKKAQAVGSWSEILNWGCGREREGFSGFFVVVGF